MIGHPAEPSALAAVAATLLGVVGVAGGALAQDTTLRIAMGSPGEAGIRVWDDIAAQFEAAHPGVDVEMNYQDDDLYQTIGLPNLLAGPNAPDIYFEWTGSRMAQRYADGYAADLTEACHDGSARGHLSTTAVCPAASRRRQGRPGARTRPTSPTCSGTTCRCSPSTASRRRRPGRSCSPPATRSSPRMSPPSRPATRTCGRPATGSATSSSRVVGEEVYDATLGGEPASSPRPSGSRRSATSRSCASTAASTRAPTAIDDNEGAPLFFQGAGGDASHRLVAGELGHRRGAGPRLRLRQPAGDARGLGGRPGQRHRRRDRLHGQRARAPTSTLAVEFLALLNSPENVAEVHREAEIIPLAMSAPTGARSTAGRCALGELLQRAPAVVLPPDTGYDLEDGRRAVRGRGGGPRRPGDPRGRARRARRAAGALTGRHRVLADRARSGAHPERAPGPPIGVASRQRSFR